MSDRFDIPDPPDADEEGSTSADADSGSAAGASSADVGGDADGDAPSEGTDEAVLRGPSGGGGGDGSTDDSPGGITDQSVPSQSPELSEGEVGHVLGSSEIRVGRTEYTVEVFVTTDQREAVLVGDYVRVPYVSSDKSLFAAVDALRYEPYTDLDDLSDTHNRIAKGRAVDESEHVLVAELDPIASVEVDGEQKDRGIVNRIPKPDATATLAEDESYLRTGLNIPQSGVFCGYLSVGGEKKMLGGDPLPYYLSNPGSVPDGSGGFDVEDGEAAIWRHLLVAGTTGKGKTHFTKNLLRQFIGGKSYQVGESKHEELGVVLLDPANEYWEMMHDNPELDDERATQLADDSTLKIGGLGEDLEVFVPQVEGTEAPAVDRMTPFCIPFSLVAERPSLLMPYDMSPVMQDALRDCLDEFFRRYSRTDDDGNGSESGQRAPLEDDNGDPPTYERFRGFLAENDHDESQLKEDNNIAPGTWQGLLRRVKSPEFTSVFDTDANRLDEYTHEMFAPGQVTVIPTRHLTRDREQLVVLSVLSFVIENKLKSYDVDANVSETPLLVGVDEAHNYLSAPGADDIRGQNIVRQARDAVRQGRKDQLGLMMITQNPEDIDDDILKQTNTNVFLGLRDEVVEKVSSVPTEFKHDIPKFGKGQAAVKAPDVEAVEVVGLDICLTQHDSE
jgi:DNA helicase HerA-like ATPase